MRLTLCRDREDILQEELNWSASRPSSRSKGVDLKLDDKQAFIKSLTVNEYDFYLRYKQVAPRGLFSLNQNPRVRGMKAHLNQEGRVVLRWCYECICVNTTTNY